MKNGEKKILSEKVADMLRTKIINGELQADSRIIESDVAKCMEVSRGCFKAFSKTALGQAAFNRIKPFIVLVKDEPSFNPSPAL